MKLIRNPKDLAVLILLMLFLLSPFLFIYARNHYIDIFRFSSIKLEKNFLRGSRSTINEAIKQIKNTDKQAYTTLIKYVDHISERPCVTTDWHLNRDDYIEGTKLPGCYTKGSKTIYLRPDANESRYVINARAKTIIKLANFSKEYWESR